MNYPLALAFLFAAGAMIGWVIEFFYRNLVSHNGPRGKYFINPGFCRGPWLPIYGIGLTLMFVISFAVTRNVTDTKASTLILVILAITLTMTIIELIGGYFLLKVLNLRLWDYRKEPGNFMGIICPKFTLIWGGLGALYVLFIHPHALDALEWLSRNLAFSFFVGLFAGLFGVDLVNSAIDAAAIKRFGDDYNIVVKYEELKSLVQKRRVELEGKAKFFVQHHNEAETLLESLKRNEEALESKKEAFRSQRKKKKLTQKDSQNPDRIQK